jgi:hypothetical protein
MSMGMDDNEPERQESMKAMTQRLIALGAEFEAVLESIKRLEIIAKSRFRRDS